MCIGARVGWWRRSSRCIVMSRLPDGHLGALDLADQVDEAVGQLDAAARDAEQDEVVGTLVVLEDLVRDAAQGPGHVARGEDGTTGRVEGVPGGHGGVGARQDADLLPCLTGQVVKGCRVRRPLYGVSPRPAGLAERTARSAGWAGSRRFATARPPGTADARPDRENSITQIYTLTQTRRDAMVARRTADPVPRARRRPPCRRPPRPTPAARCVPTRRRPRPHRPP